MFVNPNQDYNGRGFSGDAWRIDFRPYLVEASESYFNIDDYLFWYSQATNTSVKINVMGIRPDEFSNCDIDFSLREPHVTVAMQSLDDLKRCVTVEREGRLLAGIGPQPENPFSYSVHYPPVSKGKQPRLYIPGDWSGPEFHFQDVILELPIVDNELVYVPGVGLHKYIDSSPFYPQGILPPPVFLDNKH